MEFLDIILNWSICIYFLCGIYLWLRRYEGDFSRRYLSVIWIVAGALLLLRQLLDEFIICSTTYYVLPVNNLMGGILAIVLLYLYPVRIINSEWFSSRYRNIVLIPGMSLIVLLFILRPYCRELVSFNDFWLHIGEFDVILRLVILMLGILPFTVMLFYIPYNYTKSGACQEWILLYSIKILVIGVLYVLFMLTGNRIVSGIHLLANIYLCTSVTYFELFVRFNVPKEVQEQIKVETLESKTDESGIAFESDNHLIREMYKLMDEQQVWKNPDLSLIELASMLNTNRSYLSKAIQDAGYKNYSDMINRRRIAEFVNLAKAGKIENVQDAFFSVGFRSRETALRCFKKYVGVLPGDYLRGNVSAYEI